MPPVLSCPVTPLLYAIAQVMLPTVSFCIFLISKDMNTRALEAFFLGVGASLVWAWKCFIEKKKELEKAIQKEEEVEKEIEKAMKKEEEKLKREKILRNGAEIEAQIQGARRATQSVVNMRARLDSKSTASSQPTLDRYSRVRIIMYLGTHPNTR